MDKDSKIFVAGHNGMVGSSICRLLKEKGYFNLILVSRNKLDLTNKMEVLSFFKAKRPDYVFLAAAKVGGIHANNVYPADFLHDNLMIQSNVIDCSYKYKVKKLLFLGSSCIYPKFCKQPIKEEYLLGGKLEPTNESYAIAKIAGIKMCQSYNRQYGTNFISCMPTNLYGKGDNFDELNSHVLPALIRKFHFARINDEKRVVVWGSGSPRREFLYVDDLAEACLFLMINYNSSDIVNIGSGRDLTIKELANLVSKIIGTEAEIEFDTNMPDGTPQKLLDVSKLNSLGWRYKTSLEKGLKETYQWVQSNNVF